MTKENILNNLEALPGGEILKNGLEDLGNSILSINAYLVLMGAPRLRRLGIEIPDKQIKNPEHKLYDILEDKNLYGAHSEYNSLIRKLVSLERALELLHKSLVS